MSEKHQLDAGTLARGEALLVDFAWLDTAKQNGAIPIKLLIQSIAAQALDPLRNSIFKEINRADLFEIDLEYFEVVNILVLRLKKSILDRSLNVLHRVGLIDVSELPGVIQWCNQSHSLLGIDEMFGPYERLVINIDAAKNWLSSIGTPVPDWLFEVAGNSDTPPEKNIIEWPWGSHNTKHLSELRAAAEKWWKNYTPDDPTTAPTNEEVANWLIDVRKVPKRVSEVMASILRADDLAPGPRKKLCE